MYLYWFAKIYYLHIPIQERKLAVDLNGNLSYCTRYYSQGVKDVENCNIIQYLASHNHKGFVKKELHDCDWANDRVISYIKENIQLIKKDLKNLEYK